MQKILELAQAGDVTCLRMMLDRIWPVRKGQPLQVNLPEIETADDLRAGFAAILSGIGESQLTADEVTAVWRAQPRRIRVFTRNVKLLVILLIITTITSRTEIKSSLS